jgi:hypothetical protein
LKAKQIKQTDGNTEKSDERFYTFYNKSEINNIKIITGSWPEPN